MLAMGYAYVSQKEIERRENGKLPNDQFIDVHFQDIVKNPVGTIERVYERLGWPIDDDIRERVADYASHKPKGSRGVHQYSLAGVGLDAAQERERFAFYMEKYGIARQRLVYSSSAAIPYFSM